MCRRCVLTEGWSRVADPLLDRVAAAVSETADMAMGLWHADESRVRKWEKYPGHPVCEVDIEADRLLRERMTVIDPGAAWLSEETADGRGVGAATCGGRGGQDG